MFEALLRVLRVCATAIGLRRVVTWWARRRLVVISRCWDEADREWGHVQLVESNGRSARVRKHGAKHGQSDGEGPEGNGHVRPIRRRPPQPAPF